MKTLGLTLLTLFGIVGVLIFPFILFGLLLFFFGLIALFALYWAVGFPISVSMNKRKVGYIRWMTFYSTPKGL